MQKQGFTDGIEDQGLGADPSVVVIFGARLCRTGKDLDQSLEHREDEVVLVITLFPLLWLLYCILMKSFLDLTLFWLLNGVLIASFGCVAGIPHGNPCRLRPLVASVPSSIASCSVYRH